MSRVRDWFEGKGSAFKGELRFDEPLARHAYLRVGGPAALLAIPEDEASYGLCREAARELGLKRLTIGLGTNLLCDDSGFPGIVVKTQKLNPSLEFAAEAERVRIRVGASVSVSGFLRRCAQEGWDGLEFLAGIPGSMGGVAFMNGGTHLGEFKDAATEVVAIRGMDGLKRSFKGPELKYHYRGNDFLAPDDLVFSMELVALAGDPARVKAKLDDLAARRKQTQPLEFPSCGSVFKNPKEHGLRAWEVVDRLGLRGHRLGGAQISEKHPNWILNVDRAKAADVLGLIQLIKDRAQGELGIEMKEEVRIIHG